VAKMYLDLVLAKRPAVYVWTDFAHAYGFRSAQDAEEMAAGADTSQSERRHSHRRGGRKVLSYEGGLFALIQNPHKILSSRCNLAGRGHPR
jgi:hypothetical protein